MEKEFNIDAVVTVDRYNHIDDVMKGTVVGHDISMGGDLLYKIDIDGIEIRTSGRCIVESKYYDPLPANERHAKREPYITREDRVAKWNVFVSSKK
jgi:hypothetical protein